MSFNVKHKAYICCIKSKDCGCGTSELQVAVFKFVKTHKFKQIFKIC